MSAIATTLAEAERAWNAWTTTETSIGVDFIAGRGAFAQAFGAYAEVPYDLSSSPGCVVAYPRVAKVQAIGSSTGCKAILLVKSTDGIWYTDLLSPSSGTIEQPRDRETWPAESHGGAPLVYRVLRSALKPLRPSASR
jgi:hypothetical protein